MKMISFSFHSTRMGRSLATALFVAGLQLLLVAFPSGNLRAGGENEEGHFFRWINLQSDIPGVADRTDPNLVNPWGLAVGPTGIFWVADNHTGVSTLYAPNGKPNPLIVTIPASSGIATDVASPTGLVFNPFPKAFLLSNGKPALFIFDAEDGGVSAWNP
jgi:NHL repeat